MRVGAHPAGALRRKRGELALEAAIVVEQFLGPIALHPRLKDPDVLRMAAHRAHRHLMRPPVALLPLAVDLLGQVQPFGVRMTIIGQIGRFENPFLPRVSLDVPDLADHGFERGRHEFVHHRRVIALRRNEARSRTREKAIRAPHD